MTAGSAMRTVAGFAQRGELDQRGIVQQIEATNPQEGIAALLVHTPKGRHPEIRERALAKIKSRADWQEELVRLLETEAAPEALGFLSANEVDNPALFASAVPEGLLQQAAEIRRRIRHTSHPSHLYAGMLQHRRSPGAGSGKQLPRQGNGRAPSGAGDEARIRRTFAVRQKPALAAVELIDRWLAAK